MGAAPVVTLEPDGQGVGAFGGMLVGAGISPLAEGRLDEAFSFAVGLGRVGAVNLCLMPRRVQALRKAADL